MDSLVLLKVQGFTGKAMEPDGIHPIILKKLTDVIAKPLSMIFKKSWESGVVPTDWKLVNIIQIFKKLKKEDLGNYSPVSSVLGKVMEKIILGGIEKHLQDSIVISHSQQSFMRGKSFLSNLISFYGRVTHPVDLGKIANVIYLDFSNLFGKVIHSILLNKISSTQMDSRGT
ncbi:RNA-directed DNA polymerase from mobile element jockey-like protein [Willisornis vidua]|uniref:RNA-directed DNA polymerase from mobile element jockey-like protein n=1 Tax=Willisornis vidua TaxID=1566151 RepID=A0ABQ9CX54_9PASS|nr:RNA-directed DNA polymerase from mobile element jockey-like protein [Willisornis vidua]